MYKFPEMYNNKTIYMVETIGELLQSMAGVASNYDEVSDTVTVTLSYIFNTGTIGTELGNAQKQYHNIPVSAIRVLENKETSIFRSGIRYAVDELALLSEKDEITKEDIHVLIKKLLVRSYLG